MNSNPLQTLTRPLLFLVMFNLLPQVELRPLWATLFTSVLLAYRFAIEFYQLRLPSRPIIWLGQLIATMAIWVHYHSFFGDEAGGTFLTLLICLKIFELKQRRDYFFTCMLCVLVLMSYLLLDQGLLMTAFLGLDVILIVAFLRALEEQTWSWTRGRSFLRSGFVMALKASPLLLLMFILFPRFSTGFGNGANASAARMGVSDSLQPGAVAKLISSDELIFRAAFLNGEVPARSSLYWRGAVLDHSMGLNWGRSPSPERVLQAANVQVRNPDVEIYLEAGSERFLFSLDSTQSLSLPNETIHLLRRTGRIFELDQPLQTRERYYLENASTGILNEDLTPENFLGSDSHPSAEMAKFLFKFSGKPDGIVVKELLQNFQLGDYKYSLEPPPAKNIDDFMFRTKTGFCEHYAGSLATILRHLKIPSRVVVGFQGGTSSFLESYISVRGHDAHAWVEYYDRESHRWKRADPTAQLDPMRISLGSDSYFAKNLKSTWWHGDGSHFYLRLRAFLDEVEASWIGFLLHFDLATQRELLAKLGMAEVLFKALPVFLFLAFVLTLAFLYFIEAQRREKLTPDERLYAQLQKILKRWQIQKRASEGPLCLVERATAVDPELGQEVDAILAPLLGSRYGQKPLNHGAFAVLQQRLRALKKWPLRGKPTGG